MKSQRGFGLIELMISMLIGLFIIAAVSSVLISSIKTYKTTKAIVQMQETLRYAFEYIGRDIRETGLIQCGSGLNVANVLNEAAISDWAMFEPLKGIAANVELTSIPFGTQEASRIEGTEALHLSSSSSGTYMITEHNPTSATFKINESGHSFAQGDILLACDDQSAAIFQISNANVNNSTIIHNTGNSVSPGNCSKGLGIPVPDPCTVNGTAKSFAPGGFLTKFKSTFWYLGCNGRSDCLMTEGRSIYFTRLIGSSIEAIELVSGVKDLSFKYLTSNGTAYVPLSSVTAWGEVIGISLTVRLGASISLNGNDAVERSYTTYFALRNRLL
jgi:type IV pilus assembly protein PilW